MVEPITLASLLAGTAFGLASHSHTSRKRILEHPMRAAIVELVRQSPGILLCDLRRRVGCSAGTIQHHLDLLERRGIVESEQGAQRRHLFLADVDATVRRSFTLLARRGRALEFLRLVGQEPGIQQRLVTDRLSISRKALRDYVEEMQQCGLIDTEVVGGRRLYRPTPSLAELLASLDENPVDSFQEVPAQGPASPEDGSRLPDATAVALVRRP